MLWLKRLFCRHDFVWVRNIHGDEINCWGGSRSLWRCNGCGKLKAQPGLWPHQPTPAPAPRRAPTPAPRQLVRAPVPAPAPGWPLTEADFPFRRAPWNVETSPAPDRFVSGEGGDFGGAGATSTWDSPTSSSSSDCSSSSDSGSSSCSSGD